MMNNVKMCARCNHAVISNLNSPTADYYRHLSVKYCDTCREIVSREKNAERCRRYKERRKSERAGLRTAEQTQLDILRMQNNMMMREYIQVCDAISKLKKEIYSMYPPRIHDTNHK